MHAFFKKNKLHSTAEDLAKIQFLRFSLKILYAQKQTQRSHKVSQQNVRRTSVEKLYILYFSCKYNILKSSNRLSVSVAVMQ